MKVEFDGHLQLIRFKLAPYQTFTLGDRVLELKEFIGTQLHVCAMSEGNILKREGLLNPGWDY